MLYYIESNSSSPSSWDYLTYITNRQMWSLYNLNHIVVVIGSTLSWNSSIYRRFDPLLHDGRARSDETRPGRLQTRQTGALPVRVVQGDHQVLDGRPVQEAHVRRAKTGAGRPIGKPRVRRQLRGPGESRRRVGRQRQGQTIRRHIITIIYICKTFYRPYL